MSLAGAKEGTHAGVSVGRGDLAGIDKLEGEALALFCFSDQRPLSGVAGFVDWRLCGALSRALESGAFGGRRGESLLMPIWGRLGKRRLFVFGLGPLSSCDREELRRAGAEAYRIMREAGVRRPVFAAPSARGDAQRIESDFVEVVAEELRSKLAKILVEG